MFLDDVKWRKRWKDNPDFTVVISIKALAYLGNDLLQPSWHIKFYRFIGKTLQ